MRYFYFSIICIAIFSCKHKHEPLRYEKLIVDKQTKHLIDSTLAVIQQLSFTTDTTFGQRTGDKQGKIDVQINCLDSVGCFASIFIDNDSTDFAEAYIFKIDKPNYTYLYHLDYLNDHSIDVAVKDYNFDGKIDISFASFCNCSRILYGYCIFELEKSYKLIEVLEGFEIELNQKNELLTIRTDGGNFGTQERRNYKWINGKLTLIEQFDRTLIDMPFVLDKIRSDDFKEYGFKIGDTVPGIMNAYLYEHYKLIGDSLKLVDSQKEAITLEED